MAKSGRERLIFPLDVETLSEAREWARRLGPTVGVFKVGLELWSAAGPDAVRAIQSESGGRVFLDLKLHDIPETVERAARALRGLRPLLLTVHTAGGKAMLEAAVRGAGPEICVLGVTRLTSLEAGVGEVTELARLARESGCGGVVCSGTEARAVREAVGPDLRVVCPGIRPRGADVGDQVRVVTPREAIAAGADYVVVGRPIRDAADPAGAARAIGLEIESA